MSRPRRELRAAGHVLPLRDRPRLMGVVNASPDSFSDGGGERSPEDLATLAGELLDAGADIIDIGGESAVTDRPAVDAEEEATRVVPVIERVVARGALVSVDTRKPLVARAALAAGAAIVNDVSGLREEDLARACAEYDAALVLMHTRAKPKERRHDDDLYGDDVGGDVATFLAERLAVAERLGVPRDRVVLDPGPDFAKTPAQTVAALRDLDRLLALGAPVLLAISRKDFIGAITGQPPRRRLAGTLAALWWGWQAGADLFRVHDVRECADFLAVMRALDGEDAVPRDLRLADPLRHDRGPG